MTEIRDLPFRCSRCGKQAPRMDGKLSVNEWVCYRLQINGEELGPSIMATRILCYACFLALREWLLKTW